MFNSYYRKIFRIIILTRLLNHSILKIMIVVIIEIAVCRPEKTDFEELIALAQLLWPFPSPTPDKVFLL